MNGNISYFNLSPGHQTSGADSPGSSIFDLPVQSDQRQLSNSTPPTRQQHTGSAGTYSEVLDSSKGDRTSYVVVSGGTGCNSICSAFGSACYILPVSDDGGSSSEIIRVLGGPSIGEKDQQLFFEQGAERGNVGVGDIRSRLVRLIPPSPASSPLNSIRNLLAYRLPSRGSERGARDQWRDIVEGKSYLWAGIPNDRKEMIRGMKSAY